MKKSRALGSLSLLLICSVQASKRIPFFCAVIAFLYIIADGRGQRSGVASLGCWIASSGVCGPCNTSAHMQAQALVRAVLEA